MTSSQGFQTSATYQPAPAVEGDFASSNPRQSVLAGPGGLIAGSICTIAHFGWATPNPMDPNNAPALVNTTGFGAPTGILHREQQGLNTVYLSEAGMSIPAGFPVTLMDYCDIWVKNNGLTQALPGQKAYASFADGSISFAATGAALTGSATGSSIAAATFAITGSIVGNVLNVTAVGSGTVVAGATISGAGVASGTKIVSQRDGTTGGVGNYYLDIGEQSVASEAITGAYGIFTAGTVTGVISVGSVLSGAGGGGVTAGTTVRQFISGAGGTGTYVVDPTQSVTSSTITWTTNVETKWFARTGGNAGELVKMSAQAQG